MINNLTFDNPATFLLIGGVLIWAIARQLQARQLRPSRLLVVPAICLYLTVQQAPAIAHLDLVGWTFLLVSGVVGVAAGLARGLTTRSWTARDGSTWTQGTYLTLAIWAGVIAFRVTAGVVAHFAGVPAAAMMAEIAVMLTLTFGAQNAVVWLRTQQLMPAR
jgi:hypothetical protein